MSLRRAATVAITATLSLSSSVLAQDYEHYWQESVGAPAIFRVSGPATSGNVQGDAWLDEVED